VAKDAERRDGGDRDEVLRRLEQELDSKAMRNGTGEIRLDDGSPLG
jgi:hypothetical protein